MDVEVKNNPMPNSPTDKTIILCEHCSNSTFCNLLKPYNCNEYTPEINSNFNMEIRLDSENHAILVEN